MTSGRKILQAEDDENDVFFLRRALQKAGLGHTLLHVHDGQEAVDYLSGNGAFADRGKYPYPDLLLLDLKMPRMNGFDVLDWLRAHPEVKGPPVVVLSSSNHQEDVHKALALGAADFQTKPHDTDGLIEFLQGLNARWFNSAPKLEDNGVSKVQSPKARE
jgi:CheY-like chemotaxis protein